MMHHFWTIFFQVSETQWCGETRNSHQKIFRQINSLLTYLVKPLLSRNICQKCVIANSRNFHTVHCAMHNFTAATIFSQIFRQINVLLKNFTINWFDGKNLHGSESLVFPHYDVHITVWKLREFSLTHFWQKFRESNGFTHIFVHTYC